LIVKGVLFAMPFNLFAADIIDSTLGKYVVSVFITFYAITLSLKVVSDFITFIAIIESLNLDPIISTG
jgi:hypothetical protein